MLAQKEIILDLWTTVVIQIVKHRNGQWMETFELGFLLFVTFLQAWSWHLITTWTVWAMGEQSATVGQTTAVAS